MMPAVRRRLRWFVFLAAAAWMLLSPAHVQLFGGSSAGVVRAWQMFHLRGAGICSARFDDRGERIDRYALLGVDRARAPARFRRITDEEQARAMGRRICAARGPGAEVRVELRCGERQGLRTILDREEDLCAR
jgi:hypothetical protein